MNIYDKKLHSVSKARLEQKFNNYFANVKDLSSELKTVGFQSLGNTLDVNRLPEFTKLAVTAWLEPKNDDSVISANIRNILVIMNKGFDVPAYNYFSANLEDGLSNNDFGILLTHTGSDHLEMKREGDKLKLEEIQFGSTISSTTFDLAQLRKDYGENEAGINEVIIGLDYNAKHIEEYTKHLLNGK